MKSRFTFLILFYSILFYSILFYSSPSIAQNIIEEVCTTLDDEDMGTLDEICFNTTLIEPRPIFVSEIEHDNKTTGYGTGFEITAQLGNYSSQNYGIAFYRLFYVSGQDTIPSQYKQTGSLGLDFNINQDETNGNNYGTVWFDMNYNTNNQAMTINGNTTILNNEVGLQPHLYAFALYYQNADSTNIFDFFTFNRILGNFIATDGIAKDSYPHIIKYGNSNNSPPENHTFQLEDNGWYLIPSSKGNLNTNLTSTSLQNYYALRHEFLPELNLPAIYTVPPSINTWDNNTFRRVHCSNPIHFRNQNNLWENDFASISNMYDWKTTDYSTLKKRRARAIGNH